MKLSLFISFFLLTSTSAYRWGWGGGGGSGRNQQDDGDVTLESAQERDDLIFMREEEKMARDVYLTMYDKYGGEQVFANIARSEQQHMNRMLDMINRYGLTDPVTDDTIGVFQDAAIRTLYKSLIEEGNKSVLDAFMVGALIEEVDIRDLEEAIRSTDESMLDRVYGNLKSASHNHLRAFVRQIEGMGIVYMAQHLSQAQVDGILGRE